MKYLKIALFPSPFLKVITFHRVKKSQLIIGIVDRIKINKEQHVLQIAGVIYVCFVYFAAIAQVWINLHRQHVFYTVMLWKGSQVPRSLGNIRKRTKKRLWRKSQSRSRRFSFHKHFTTFPTYFFFSITLLYHFFFYTFFTHNIYPYPHPRPTTSTHYPRPTTFSYTPQ